MVLGYGQKRAELRRWVKTKHVDAKVRQGSCVEARTKCDETAVGWRLETMSVDRSP